MSLGEMTDEQLLREAAKAVQRAARGEANGGDNETYVRAMQFKVESDKRLTAAGHDKRCQSGIYSLAFEQATAQHAGREPRLLACSCGAVSA